MIKQLSFFGEDFSSYAGSKISRESKTNYDDFVEKFKPKLTTDDCYTPDNIYEVIADFVAKQYGRQRDTFCRPFYHNGDYEREDYTGKIVVDNPPFSILTQIVSFYQAHSIGFFLFAPTNTMLGAAYKSKATVIPCDGDITYHNGANVRTSFITNLEPPDIVLTTYPELHDAICEANRENIKAQKRQLPKYVYPDNVVTTAIVGTWASHGVKYTVHSDDCVFVRALDAQKPFGKALFGAGLLLSERAAAERAAAERAAAERRAAHQWELSERELLIVKDIEAKGGGWR